jgi:hypothetical protein
VSFGLCHITLCLIVPSRLLFFNSNPLLVSTEPTFTQISSVKLHKHFMLKEIQFILDLFILVNPDLVELELCSMMKLKTQSTQEKQKLKKNNKTSFLFFFSTNQSKDESKGKFVQRWNRSFNCSYWRCRKKF